MTNSRLPTVVIAILGIVSMVVGLLLSIILPEIRFYALVLIAFGIILIVVAAIVDFRRVKGAVTSKRGKFSTSTGLMVAIFAGIIVLVNAISVGVNHQYDFTALASFTLTSQTKDVLSKIKTPVKVLCFFTPADDANHTAGYASSMLTQYENFTNNLQITVIDPDKNPEEARKYGITSTDLYESVVFEQGNNQFAVYPQQIQSEAEYSFTNAILEVTGIVERKIYFVIGDGEASPLDTLSNASYILKINLLQVMTIDLHYSTSIPDDCAVLVIAGPTNPMTDSERQIVNDYLKKNKQAIIMTNPGAPDDVAKILSPWGVNVVGGTILDPTSNVGGSLSTPNVPASQSSAVVSSIIKTSVFFPGATALLPQSTLPTNIDARALVWSSKDAWIDKNYDPTKPAKFDPTTETKQISFIGMIINPTYQYDDNNNITGVNDGPYIIAFGDSDFISNSNFSNGNNADLFLNMVKELGAGSEIMSIDRKVLPTRMLILSPEEENFLNISSIALLPAIVLIIGVLMWWRRR
jgi:ABC-type uncharacterized transport system involved in gliding motility auxiliary subunit